MKSMMQALDILSGEAGPVWHRSLLAAILSSASEAILVCDASGGIVIANAAAKALGLDAPHMPGVNEAGERPLFYNADQQALSFDEQPLIRVLRAGLEIRGEPVFIYRPDGELRELRVNAAPVLRERGEVLGAAGLFTDVTEKNRAYRAMVQTEKLALTGKLAAILTHEISNPLQASIGCLGLAEEVLAENGDASRYLAVAADELKRAAKILTQLRDVNRSSSPGSREPVDLVEAVNQILSLNRSRLGDQGVEVELQAADDLPAIHAIPDQIRQVFLNLILNALDAMPSGGKLTIRLLPVFAPDGVEVRVQDSGEGIRAEEIERIFEPFFTTRKGGLGLGLFVTREIIEAHGGNIRLQSKPGAGTTFSVWLPTNTGG